MAVGRRVSADPKRRKWTAEEFYRLVDLNFFLEQRVELIEGEIMLMASQKNFHAIGITLTEDALRAVFGPTYWVRVQMSLDLSPFSVLDPDVAVIKGAVRTHDPSHNPTSALLIVEVSESTLRYDRGRKASIYARSGIADYWILNLLKRQLEVHRDPAPDPKRPLGYGYSTIRDLGPTDTVSPLALPQGSITVADLLPDAAQPTRSRIQRMLWMHPSLHQKAAKTSPSGSRTICG